MRRYGGHAPLSSMEAMLRTAFLLLLAVEISPLFAAEAAATAQGSRLRPPQALANRGLGVLNRRRSLLGTISASDIIALHAEPAVVQEKAGLVRTRGCTKPINQVQHRHVGDSSTAEITGLWLGTWQNHDNTADDEWGPGKGGAACQSKDSSGAMQWGKAFKTMSKKCVVGNALTTDWYFELYNTELGEGPNKGLWMDVIKKIKVYYAPDGSGDARVQRIDITTDMWKDDPPGKGTFLNEPVTNFIGKPAAEMPAETISEVFAAPEGMVLGDLSVLCKTPKGQRARSLASIKSACAMKPKWHPAPFKKMDEAEAYGYKCSQA